MKTASLIVKRLFGKPFAAVDGYKYHARITHLGGRVEYFVGRLRRNRDGTRWLDPMSPNRRSYALAGGSAYQIKLLGHVIATYRPED